jgi:hypothetical protein
VGAYLKPALRKLCATAVFLWALPVLAQSKVDFPFTGYFSQQHSPEIPAFQQALCAFAFFKQFSDGRVVDYVLDRPFFEKTRKVRFLQEMASQCIYDPATSTDECTKLTDSRMLPKGGKTFEVIEKSDGDAPFIRLFRTPEARAAYMRAPNGTSTMGSPIYMHRCIGFTDKNLSNHIDETLALDPANAMQTFADHFDKKLIPDALRIMEEISPEAANATLPGQ